MIEILKNLITIPSISGDHEKSAKLFEYIKKELLGLDLFFTDCNSNNFKSLLITTKETKSPTIWLVAHIDVVPGKEDLFKAKVIDNKLYGRGAYDMKFAAAAYIATFKELGQKVKDLNVGIMFTSDEEVAGYDGVGYILKQGYSSDIAFLPDGGTEWKFEKMSKGVFQYRVISYGASAHSSRPWQGKNAIMQLSAFLTKLEKNFPKEPCGDENHVHNSINTGMIIGGKAVNQIPDIAEATIDIRFLPMWSEEKIVAMLEKAKPKDADIIFERIDFVSSFSTNIDNKYLATFYEIAKEKYGILQEAIISHGSSDARFFGEKNIPVILTRPIGGGHHSDEEWISVSDLERFKEVLKIFIQKI